MTLRDARILVTGATGQVAFPVALALAGDNDVVAVARFSDGAKRARLEAAGVECVAVDLARGSPVSVAKLIGVALIIAGVVTLNLAGPH